MFKRILFFIFILPLVSMSIHACKPEEVIEKVFPALVSSNPIEGASTVDVNTIVTIVFSEKIVLATNANVKLNGVIVPVSVNSNTLVINAVLKPSTTYTLLIPGTAIKNEAGNFAKEITLNFATNQSVSSASTVYEAETATLTADASVSI